MTSEVDTPPNHGQLIRRARNHISKSGSTSLLAIVLTILVIAGILMPSVTSAQCIQKQLDSTVDRWVTSGAWDGDRLVLADMLQGIVPGLAAAEVGAKLKNLSNDGTLGLRISQIRVRPGQFLVEDDIANRIYRFGNDLTQSEETIKIEDKILEDAEGDKIKLKEIYDWTPLDKGFLAFADYIRLDEREQEQGWASAFLYFDEMGKYRIYKEVALNDPVTHHYTKAVYIAGLGQEKGYILFRDERPWIGEVTTDSDEIRMLEHFPADFRSEPGIKDLSGPHNARNVARIYKVFENSRMAVSLHAGSGGEYIYLLTKEAMRRNGATSWWLIQLDAQDGYEIARARLPTETAAHLTVVPGESHWGFVIKEAVEIYGDYDVLMDTNSIVEIPTEWIENLEGSPLTATASPNCRIVSD